MVSRAVSCVLRTVPITALQHLPGVFLLGGWIQPGRSEGWLIFIREPDGKRQAFPSFFHLFCRYFLSSRAVPDPRERSPSSRRSSVRAVGFSPRRGREEVGRESRAFFRGGADTYHLHRPLRHPAAAVERASRAVAQPRFGDGSSWLPPRSPLPGGSRRVAWLLRAMVLGRFYAFLALPHVL